MQHGSISIRTEFYLRACTDQIITAATLHKVNGGSKVFAAATIPVHVPSQWPEVKNINCYTHEAYDYYCNKRIVTKNC